jgi:phage baseplate assembly protein W
MSTPGGMTLKEEISLREKFQSNKELNAFTFPIGIKTPLEIGQENGDSLFKMHYKLENQIADNLKNLILTRKGERIGFYDFGTDIHKTYSAELSENDLTDFVMKEISAAVSKYMPAINLKNLYSNQLKEEEFEQSVRDSEAIFTNVEESLRDKKANDFYKGLENITINKSSIKKNNDLEVVYKIIVEYNIPAEITDQSQTLELFLRTSR